jgi:hypothetical protein
LVLGGRIPNAATTANAETLAAINPDLTMADRIIKDIRYYESNVPNIDGNSMPHNLGQLFKPTSDTNFIGQRIARKLNELKFCYGEFDHIYINLTTALAENSFLISNRNLDRRIKYIDYGLLPITYNKLTDTDKNLLLKSITFRILKHISIADSDNLKKVADVEILISNLDTEISIHYKTKQTNNYKVDISYQIQPASSSTRAIIEYLDKKNNSKRQGFIPLQFYDDIYSLVDTITLKDDNLTLNPKKSFTADIHNERYKTPINLRLSDLDRI